jgi:hypothetical protein
VYATEVVRPKLGVIDEKRYFVSCCFAPFVVRTRNGGGEMQKLKVLISYDMVPGKEQECQEYFVNKFAPGLAKMGFRISDVWYTMWGEAPQILSGGVVDDVEEAQKIFLSSPWTKLVDGIEPLTENFHVRFLQLEENNN